MFRCLLLAFHNCWVTANISALHNAYEKQRSREMRLSTETSYKERPQDITEIDHLTCTVASENRHKSSKYLSLTGKSSSQKCRKSNLNVREVSLSVGTWSCLPSSDGELTRILSSQVAATHTSPPMFSRISLLYFSECGDYRCINLEVSLKFSLLCMIFKGL